ncbi:hypothetical protein A2W14_06785 [Candidatus Gottesmanbacteria bacterium RBG_16_37_8]|uniref:GIY-YIG domain-containing protein n=1 Tax=Candidatus Gottesmanbacteria bacterium RBG_16_37_8 TaxID=1798371 RepID=A0A1F5YX04_9BACT|nr:MAG: hypothetical protein A2W14_06785 [Candidatus Gottesmanbacteria bacterium RBG_16_37_8]
MTWFIYLAKGKDKSLYTGITTNIKRREKEHNFDNKLGSKSLRAKRPVKIVYSELYNNQSEAREREIEIKSWKRKYKLKLIEGNNGFTRKFSSENVPGP